jgi:beta-lactamase class A
MIRALLLLSLLLASCGAPSSDKQSNAETAHQQDSVVAEPDQHTALRQKLEQIIAPYKATVGVAVQHIENRDTLTINNNHHYPMQSVYKFPLAMAVLHKVDKGELSLDRKMHIGKEDLRPTWSPLRDKYPKGNIDLTIADLLMYTVSHSDNNTCNFLFRLLQGPKNVEQYVHQLGIRKIAIATTEEEMAKQWDVQYTNWTEPFAMVQLLDAFYQRKHLSDTSTNFLLQIMTESANNPRRIKGQLPAETVVAHKTGTSGTNDQGLTAANNDVGIITLPDGKHIALAVFVSNSMETMETNDKIIADISKAIFDYFAGKKK